MEKIKLLIILTPKKIGIFLINLVTYEMSYMITDWLKPLLK
jgi:hypothetical protein